MLQHFGVFCYSSLSYTLKRKDRGMCWKRWGCGGRERREWENRKGDEGLSWEEIKKSCLCYLVLKWLRVGLFPNSQIWWWGKGGLNQGHQQEKKRHISELAQELVSILLGKTLFTSLMLKKTNLRMSITSVDAYYMLSDLHGFHPPHPTLRVGTIIILTLDFRSKKWNNLPKVTQVTSNQDRIEFQSN